MVNPEYHKGQSCAYREILCQEGFCSECIIYLEQLPQTLSAPILENNLFEFKSKVYNKQHLNLK
jgi:hypothetical protein